MYKLFKNATFHLMSNQTAIASAILVKDGIIEDIWFSDKVIPSGVEVIDLRGYHVFPGFIDTHTHSFEGGLYSQSLDLSDVISIKQTLEKIDVFYHAQMNLQKDTLDAFRYDENKIEEKRFPTTNELDSVCPNMPLVLRRIDGHSSVVNSIAWDNFSAANQKYLSKLNKYANKDELGNQNYLLRGELNDKLVHWFHNSYSEQTILQAYTEASKIALRNGITTVHTMVGDAEDNIMHYAFIQKNLKQFKVEFIIYPQSFNIKAALELGATRIGGCILADGSLGSFTAALVQPYLNKPEEHGKLYHTDDFWNDFVDKAVLNDLQVAVHCIGDKAIKQINDAYQKAAIKYGKDTRNELIHCELTPDFLVDEISRAGSIPVMQPAFDMYWGGSEGFYQNVLGMNRSSKMNRFRTFIDHNVPVTGGSDWYITELNALQGIESAVNHNTRAERITAYEAIKMYTVNAAYLSHDENRLGRLLVGHAADFVCFSADLLDIKGLESNPVLATFKNGDLVYSR